MADQIRFGPADREGWVEERTCALDRLAHDARELLDRVKSMAAVAISGLDEQHVGLLDRLGIQQKRLVQSTQVAGALAPKNCSVAPSGLLTSHSPAGVL